VEHRHPSPSAAHRGRLTVVFGLTLLAFAGELVGGLMTNSLALLADAGHLFSDVVGIGLALAAIAVAGRPASAGRTFGFLRIEILAAAVNAMLLFGVAAFVLLEAWRRFAVPADILSTPMLVVALAGLALNGVSLWLLRDAQRASLNLRGAYLEVLGDLAGSAAVVAAALAIATTGSTGADAVASVAIGLMILPRAGLLLRDALHVLLEATPRGVDLEAVRDHILEAEGVVDVHDLHAWTITSGMNVVSAHVVLEPSADPPGVLDELCRCLSGDFDIEHSTFQLESADRRRLEESTHA
jgi:cobalt-zinc-cadmium efflux system protein